LNSVCPWGIKIVRFLISGGSRGSPNSGFRSGPAARSRSPLVLAPTLFRGAAPAPPVVNASRGPGDPGYFSTRQGAEGDGRVSAVLRYLLFAMVSGFLLLRLRSVLGRRTVKRSAARTVWCGRTRPRLRRGRLVIEPSPPPLFTTNTSRRRCGRGRIEPDTTRRLYFDPLSTPLGPRTAFEMTLLAFANADNAGLRPLLE